MQSHSQRRCGHAAPFRDWASLSDAELLALLVPHANSIRSAENAAAEHVRVLRERDVSWARIGAALGISKQAAWERFAAGS
jgi:ATP-dependent Clp protease ATP-binding subunit ClpX